MVRLFLSGEEMGSAVPILHKPLKPPPTNPPTRRRRGQTGNRIVLFAPVYLANFCVNSCTYCAFRGANKGMERSMLTMDELRQEVEALEAIGHKRLLLLTGEHPKYSFELFLEAVSVVGGVKSAHPCGEIRRINVEIPSLSVSDMRRLKATQYIGTFGGVTAGVQRTGHGSRCCCASSPTCPTIPSHTVSLCLFENTIRDLHALPGECM